MSARKLIFLSAVFSFFAAVLPAQTSYWVDANKGSDTNPGTYAKPFKSITKGVATLSKGDTLFILPGVYSKTKTGEVFPIRIGGGSVDQTKVRIIALYGPAVTILDGEGKVGSYMVRFYNLGAGSKLWGLQIANSLSTPGWWDIAVRLGSPSGGSFATHDVEVAGCIFNKVNRGVVIWSKSGGNNLVHDNLFINTMNDAINHFGDPSEKPSSIFNNTIINAKTLAVLEDGATTQGLLANNIAFGSPDRGIVIDTTATKLLVENNDSYGNKRNYVTKVSLSKSNLSIDPLFVDPSKGDFHLKTGSPLIGKGWMGDLSLFRTPDLFGGARVFDFNGDGKALVDIGCHEVSDVLTWQTGNWAPSGTVTVHHKGPVAYMAIDFFGLEAPGLTLPGLGTFLLDPSFLLPVTFTESPTGTYKITFPNDPYLSGGIRVFLQSVYVSPKFVSKPSNIDLGIF